MKNKIKKIHCRSKYNCTFVQELFKNLNLNSMQNTTEKSESLRNKKRNLRPTRSSDTQKRAVCGRAVVNDHHVVLITTVTPNEQDASYILHNEMFTEIQLFDAIGDKVNELKKDGYEIDYRLKDELTININI